MFFEKFDERGKDAAGSIIAWFAHITFFMYRNNFSYFKALRKFRL